MSRGGARRLVGCALVALVVCLGWAAPASAHAELVSSTPAAGSEVSDGTASLVLGFSEQVLADFSQVSVTGPDGGDAVAGKVVADGGELFVPLAPLQQAGTWTVDYRVVAEDGHEVEGRYDFRLTRAGARAGSTVTTPAPPTALGDGTGPGEGPPPESMRALPVPAWLIAGVGLVGLVVLLQRSTRRRGAAEVAS